MATLILSTAGAAIGSALLPSGVSILGATITGAAIGGAIGTLAGNYADGALFGRKTRVSGARLSDLQAQTSSEGAAIPRVWGRARIAGQVIWAARFKESAGETESGGKGGGGTVATNYSYTASFAVGLCEGVISRIGRIWADGKVLDQTGMTLRVYQGTEQQSPDPLIELIEGAGAAPAFRGLAYAVFEDLPLEKFGNRVPQLQFEVFRRPAAAALEDKIKGVNQIPGTGEFALAAQPVARIAGFGVSASENVNNASGAADIIEALDQLDAGLPEADAVMLTVSWFGTDLRCGVCEIKPGVEIASKTTSPITWKAGGVTRAGAHLISQTAGAANYGGTPSDASVVQAIADLKSRGKAVLLYPFVLMDVPPGNALPNPYEPASAQAAFPWRGRITCHPAAGISGSPDRTAAAATQVDAFFGTAVPAHFAMSGGEVVYSGPAEWSYRRFILHLAKLAVLAGGVDGFVIGSELRGMTTIRSSASAFPAVAKLKALAADVRSILGSSSKITYAADWTEYSGHQPTDGSNDVYFHLDPLWSDANIDAVGIDLYAPMADWRDGSGHADAAAGYKGPYDTAYLQNNIEHGEDYDWYYASAAARMAQTREPITDGAFGEPWVFRRKDMRNWWRNAHHDRPGGVRNASPTSWTPESKPIWLTEFGCPAVDKGSNQPNVFYDPKSSESALPHFSTGRRDDLAQRRCLEAILEYWTPAAGNNPLSAVYGGPMIDPARMFVWAWDARPYPDFPLRDDVWRDAANWEKGHWLNGRMGLVPASAAITELCASAGVTDVDATAVDALVTGYVVSEPASARALIEPLTSAFHLDAFESQGVIRILPRGRAPAATVTADMLAVDAREDATRYTLTRAQEGDLSPALRVTYADAWADYRSGMAEARRAGAARGRVSQIGLDMVLETSEAQAVADRLLAQAWAGRETAQFSLPPSQIALEPGDVVTWQVTNPVRTFAISSVTDAGLREIEAQAVEPSVYTPSAGAVRARMVRSTGRPGEAPVRFMDLPLLKGDELPHAAHLAGFAEPWPGRVNVLKAVGGSFSQNTQILAPATMGETATALYAGPEGRWDFGNAVWVRLSTGALTSRSMADVLAGANVCAIQNADGAWEVLQFLNAELTAPLTYKLSGLLRGQAGTEGAMRNPVAAGAGFVLITSALRQAAMSLSDRNVAVTWKYGPAGVALDDPRYVETSLTLQGVGLRPLSPVRIRGRRDAATQDITLTWIRRTRIGGDGWDSADVPLGEALESYRVQILNGGLGVRTLTVSGPTAVYTAAQQTADFGNTSFSPLDVAIAQVSDVFGAGATRTERLYV
jgi:hypothetical protein